MFKNGKTGHTLSMKAKEAKTKVTGIIKGAKNRHVDKSPLVKFLYL